MKLGDVDVTGQLQPGEDGALEGVISGFIDGTNTLTASSGDERVTQRVRAWPLTGPMISGPHLPLLACSTEAAGLGAPTDANCSAPTNVRWRYLTPAGEVKDLADPAVLPADVARAEVAGEADVPLVIRHEVGVVNRSVYEIATIDPSPGGSDSDQSDAAWNRRLVYRYGDGCGATFGQGTASAQAVDAAYLRAGYAVATATFNSGSVQCNDVLSAETTMMVKERFVEEFGVPDLTIGEGVGGGAALLHLMIQNYPGIVDGAVALDPLPDHLTVANGIADCLVLERYYATPEGAALTPAQRTAVGGSASERTCQRWAAGAGSLFDPSAGCDPAIDATKIYDATTNPGGVRCTIQDANVNQLGRMPGAAFALRPLDNVGVQYGLTGVQRRRHHLRAVRLAQRGRRRARPRRAAADHPPRRRPDRRPGRLRDRPRLHRRRRPAEDPDHRRRPLRRCRRRPQRPVPGLRPARPPHPRRLGRNGPRLPDLDPRRPGAGRRPRGRGRRRRVGHGAPRRRRRRVAIRAARAHASRRRRGQLRSPRGDAAGRGAPTSTRRTVPASSPTRCSATRASRPVPPSATTS